MRCVVLSLLLVALGCSTPETTRPEAPPAVAARSRIRWAALGDSYTKGEAADADEAWPAVAARRLRAEARDITLVANLGRTGWTTRDVLEKQVPWLATHSADLVTIQVGINDLVQGASAEEFRAAFRELLRAVAERTDGRVVAVTIPDFSVARAASAFGDRKEIHDEIVRRNAIIHDESARQGVRVADIFSRSRDAAGDPSLLAADGIHPSAAGYAAWVSVVIPPLEETIDRR